MPTVSVTITPGSNMTKTTDSGAASQTDLSGAMTDVVYTADDGYYFPEDYSVEAVNGITVTRNSYTQITVSGTPTADATITLTAPTAKTTPAAPTTAGAVDCTTSDNNDGKLTGVTTAMEYKKSDAESWTVGTGSDITGLVPGTYYVRVKATETTNASTNQELTIKGFISYGKWNEGEGDAATADKTVTLTGHDGDTLNLTADQIPAVGSKPNDTYKAGSWDVTPSTNTAITGATTYTYTYAQKDRISQTVTFKVVNGSWNDETTTDKTVTLTGYEGDTLKLAVADIPAVGTKPNDTYKAGSWDTTPSADTEITADTTYTYTYAQKDAISQTVTFKVVNGSWNDETTTDKTVTLTGYEGDTLKLTADQIPAVGTKPNDTYKAGSWDVTPSTDTAITAATTYTYTYAQKDSISQTVTFKVVNGKWDDDSTEDKTVTLTGHDGDTLKLTADQIPAVGTKPNNNYKEGSWDTEPNTDTAITEATTFTYTYAQKDSISQTVTFKVLNGSWDDETTADKTVTLTGYEGDTLKLAANQIPAVGTKPNDTYKAGSWDVTPSADTAITADTIYTYTYAQKDGISQTVTFKVANGKWDDDTTADKTVTLTGYEGDTLKLAENQIPAVGSKPSDTYKAGSWDVTPSTETAITAATTYTYAYAQKESISQTVTFKVVNGKWDDETTADKIVTLTGYEGDTLKLAANQIPAAGTKPNDTYKAGSWDVTPSTDTAITETKTYTYTYAAKEASVVTKAPEAKTLTYNGQAQALVTAGEATGGKMQYALGDANGATQPYTTSIPTGVNAGTYYVWYKAVSDEDHSDSKPACITVTISKPAVAPAPADEEKGEANFKPSAAAPDVKGVEQEAIKTQMEELAKADDTKLKAGQVKEVTVNMETKAVAESDVPKKEASAIKETAEGMIPAKDRESTKCDFLDIAVSKIVIVYDVKNGQKVKNESDSISAGLTNLAQVIDIPVKYDLTGKFNPLIVRYHNGKAEAFRRLYAAPAKDALKDGTYYVEGTGKNAIVHIYTNRFSTYALLTSGTEEYPKLGDSVTVYRLYYGPTMEHFYTTSAYERRVLIDKYGWVDEGIAWKSPKAPTTDEEKKTIKPVYRLFNPFTTDHHYTKDANERKTLIEKYGWKDEGVAFYSNEKGDATVYRLWHPGLITGAHHFTTGKHEYDVLITRGWIGETEAFKVNAAS